MSFQSLLSSFQNATKTSSSSSSSPTPSSNTASTSTKRNNSTNSSSLKQYKNDKPALAEDIENLWRTSQIQSCFKKKSNVTSTTTTAATKTKGEINNDKSNKIHQPLHIAICATIVKDFPHEDIWKAWLNHEPKNKSASASIHIHAKTPNLIPKGTWLKSKIIPICHNPNWNDYRIILSMLSLAEYAMKINPQTTHFMMVTESCIPIGTIEELATIIRDNNNNNNNNNNGGGEHCSFLDFYGINSTRCNRFEEHACFNIKGIPKDAIYKALPGWALFSRHHMEEIINISQRLNGRELYPLFEKVWAPEEVYFPTVLALLGKLNLNQHSDDQVVRRSIMWAKWDTMNSRGSDRAHPIVYDGQLSRRLIEEVKRDGFIFMRKWKRRLPLNAWEALVIPVKNSNMDRKRRQRSGHFDNAKDAEDDDADYAEIEDGRSKKIKLCT